MTKIFTYDNALDHLTSVSYDDTSEQSGYSERYENLKNFLARLPHSDSLTEPTANDDGIYKRSTVRNRLLAVGMSKFDVSTLEARMLHKKLRRGELIEAAMSGWTRPGGFAMLIATQYRIIWLKVRPFFSTEDDLAYDTLGAITYSTNRWHASVTLHTHNGNYTLNFASLAAVNLFIAYIESRL